MGIVASRAGQRFGLTITGALSELFDVAYDGHLRIAFVQTINGSEFHQGKPRSIVNLANVSPADMNVPLKMTLLADGFGKLT